MTLPTPNGSAPDPMAPYRPAHFAPPPRETGSTYADGMAAIAYVVGNLDVFGAEFELTPRQLAAAVHVAPVATAYRDDESPAVLARISRAVDNIAARQRRIVAIAAREAADRQTPPPTPQDAPQATNGPNGGPRVPRPTPPPTQPPMAPAVPVAPSRQYVRQDADRIAF